MRRPVVLITGAGGEIGHGLIERLASRNDRAIVTLDVSRLDVSIAGKVEREITGSILDRNLLDRVLAEFQVELVFHLAALLSTRSEFTPVTAHQVNVEGTLNLLEFAQQPRECSGCDTASPGFAAKYGRMRHPPSCRCLPQRAPQRTSSACVAQQFQRFHEPFVLLHAEENGGRGAIPGNRHHVLLFLQRSNQIEQVGLGV